MGSWLGDRVKDFALGSAGAVDLVFGTDLAAKVYTNQAASDLIANAPADADPVQLALQVQDIADHAFANNDQVVHAAAEKTAEQVKNGLSTGLKTVLVIGVLGVGLYALNTVKAFIPRRSSST